MLFAALTLILHAVPLEPAFLTGDVPTRVRLVDAEAPSTNYETWTRARLRAEYDRLDESRPGIGVPLLLMLGGTTGAGICAVWFGSALSSFFGIEVTLAVALSVSMVVFAGLAIVGTILLVRNWPERRDTAKKMDEIEEIYRAGFWRTPQQQPCPQTPEPAPSGPPPEGPPPPAYHPSPSQVMREAPLTLVTF